jgi:Raf kinase inhibitor-like YbhB/YbcL family protein
MRLTTIVLLALAGAGASGAAAAPKATPAALRLESPAFTGGGEIPRKHTCLGDDVSPALEWSGAPAGTKSFALIVDDPDAPDPAAPKMTWVHWVLYNLPADTRSLPERALKASLPAGALPGLNDWKKPAWGGPCPPIGRHRYFFKLYALDTRLADLHQPTKARLLETMQGHVLATAELVGTFKK